MPKVADDTVSAKDLLDILTRTYADVIPIVSRKVNIGNFETIDVGLALRLPVQVAEAIDSPEDFDLLVEKLSAVIDKGVGFLSEETFVRYMAIKEQLSPPKDG